MSGYKVSVKIRPDLFKGVGREALVKSLQAAARETASEIGDDFREDLPRVSGQLQDTGRIGFVPMPTGVTLQPEVKHYYGFLPQRDELQEDLAAQAKDKIVSRMREDLKRRLKRG